jgi:hypothetical protein
MTPSDNRITADQQRAYFVWIVGCWLTTIVYVCYPELYGANAREKFVLIFIAAAVAGAMMRATKGTRLRALIAGALAAMLALASFFLLPWLVGVPTTRGTRLHLMCLIPGVLVAMKVYQALTTSNTGK